ncbi:MAG: anhydro-N-acetylmuramic acid kinase [Bryobacterales bacterium]|nr:anhydro-N-acetylmuramic acid kinase [Bryobacterales bacterium]
MIVAGIMSGTSLDGIDVAIVDIEQLSPFRFTLLAAHSEPYTPEVREAILGVSNCMAHTAELTRLHVLLGELYADAIERAMRASGLAAPLDLIGCHGQTIYHQGEAQLYLGRPIAGTLQIGEPSTMAERFGIPVVSDFRPRDMAAGGKGAPLVPFLDYLVFSDATVPRIALNIGGIANLTAIPAGARPEQIIAFDTGPGNMVMDSLIRRATGGRETFDEGGRIGRRGRPIKEFVERELESNPYYAATPPKTAGREQYGDAMVSALETIGRPIEDLLATATLLTARSIALGVRRFALPCLAGAPERLEETSVRAEMLVAGGGRHNAFLMELLAAELPALRIGGTEPFHLPTDFKEAIAFAALAYASIHGQPGNIPSATGARHAVVLGKVTH